MDKHTSTSGFKMVAIATILLTKTNQSEPNRQVNLRLYNFDAHVTCNFDNVY